MSADQIYQSLVCVVAVALTGWGIAYGYATYQGDQCNQSFNDRNQSLQVRSKTVQTRAASLQARIDSDKAQIDRFNDATGRKD